MKVKQPDLLVPRRDRKVRSAMIYRQVARSAAIKILRQCVPHKPLPQRKYHEHEPSSLHCKHEQICVCFVAETYTFVGELAGVPLPVLDDTSNARADHCLR